MCCWESTACSRYNIVIDATLLSTQNLNGFSIARPRVSASATTFSANAETYVPSAVRHQMQSPCTVFEGDLPVSRKQGAVRLFATFVAQRHAQLAPVPNGRA